MRIGAVEEIVDEGITGLTTSSPDELPNLLGAAAALDRRAVHERARARFSHERMARAYARVFDQCVQTGP